MQKIGGVFASLSGSSGTGEHPFARAILPMNVQISAKDAKNLLPKPGSSRQTSFFIARTTSV